MAGWVICGLAQGATVSFKDWILRRGIRIGWSTGRPFDPRDQIRTSGVDDIIKAKEKRDGVNGSVGKMEQKSV